ncbi:MAG: Antitoxin YxxD [Holosporales bacterium]
MVYEYLSKELVKNKDGFIDLTCTNYFISLDQGILKEAESIIDMPFPSELKQFYQEVGYGNLSAPKDVPEGYCFYSRNMILHPLAIARFKIGQLLNPDLDSYMQQDVYEDLSPDDLPFFEIGDSSSFMIMKPKSDTPNAVWYMGMEKIEDSFERFIWRLYHESPGYYGNTIEAYCKKFQQL